MSGDEIDLNALPTHDTSGLPWPLAKALGDQGFAYLVMLRNGAIIECTGANRDEEKEWITLLDATIVHPIGLVYNLERGLCVRISDIVAAVDAPHGS